MMDDAPREIVQKLSDSRKYRNLCPETLLRISRWALERHPRTPDAIKAAKRKLHQIYGAYIENINHNKIEDAISQYDALTRSVSSKELCEQILLHHISTAERLPFLRNLYKDIFSLINSPRSILDLACGLNPFTIPWMNLQEGVSYTGTDIDCRLCSIVNRFLTRFETHHQVYCRDILSGELEFAADVVFLFKTLPSLEQQVKGISRRLVQSINADNLVISFPTGSLCGKKKGMVENYSAFIKKITAGLISEMHVLTYSTEVFYILTKSD